MAAKIKDGLFIGDAETSQSEDFINDNKISNLINLSGREVPNYWAAHGLVYLSFHWEDRPDFKLGLTTYKRPSEKGDFISDMVDFIDVSIRHGISVLIFSRNGTGRSAVAVCVYLMVKYKWGFQKTYDFVYSKKPDININRGFIQQLFAFDKYLLMQQAKGEKQQQILSQQLRNDQADPAALLNLVASATLSKSEILRWKDWDPAYIFPKSVQSGHGPSPQVDYDHDEVLLINSFINSKHTITSLPGPYRGAMDIPKRFRLRFSDVRLEEDVNMFPTSPSSTVGIVPKGVLRVKLLPSQPHQQQQQQQQSQAKSRADSDSKGSSPYQPSSSAGVKEVMMKRVQDMADYKAGRVTDIVRQDDNESIVSDVSSVDNAMSPPRVQVSQPKQRELNVVKSTAVANSSTSDLYGYVGVSRDLSRQQAQGRVQPFSSEQTKQMTAEERLRNLVADMQQGSQQPQQAQCAPPRMGNPEESSLRGPIKGAVSAGLAQGSISSVSSATVNSSAPSLYDLATMHMAPTRGPTAGGSSSRGDDPLAAFEQIQRSGAVRANRDVVTGANGTYTDFTPGARQASGRKAGTGGWTADVSSGNGNGTRVSPRYASPHVGSQHQHRPDAATPLAQQQPQPSRVYRYQTLMSNRFLKFVDLCMYPLVCCLFVCACTPLDLSGTGVPPHVYNRRIQVLDSPLHLLVVLIDLTAVGANG
jgi:protein-tyrosine phosphatase